MPNITLLNLSITKRADGRVCKKIDGRVRIWADEETARRDLLAIIALKENPAAMAAPVPVADATVRDVFNAFVVDRQQVMAAGKMAPRSFYDIKNACEKFITALEAWKPLTPDPVSLLGRNVPIAMLQPVHFRHVRATWSKKWGPWAISRNVVNARSAFRWGCEVQRLTQTMPWWADEFKIAGKAEKRAERRRREQDRGERRFTVAELKAILGTLEGRVRAWVLLGLNAGMYSRDIALLRWRDIIRTDRLWILDTVRNKTQAPQKAPLWPETVEALKAYGPGDPDAYVFVTPAGRPYFTEKPVFDAAGRMTTIKAHDPIARGFARATKNLDIKRTGVNFGAFRHTHVSATSTHPDVNARRIVRGHRIDGIEEHYDFADTKRLKAVTDLARKRLYTSLVKNRTKAKVVVAKA
ncbi:MAG: site-specific tyrosine recombinase XerC [Phycisphaerales bacterium]|nr:site-specific tyrosine recombinase XerC [Phycisphaerales bacterium]